MYKFNKVFLAATLTLLIHSSWAEDVQYQQRNLPNGDMEMSYSANDGSKVTALQHQDGSVETTNTNANGTKSVSIQHADGSIDTHVTTSKK